MKLQNPVYLLLRCHLQDLRLLAWKVNEYIHERYLHHARLAWHKLNDANIQYSYSHHSFKYPWLGVVDMDHMYFIKWISWCFPSPPITRSAYPSRCKTWTNCKTLSLYWILTLIPIYESAKIAICTKTGRKQADDFIKGHLIAYSSLKCS